MKEMSRVVFAYILWAVSVVLSALIALTARDVIFNGFVLGINFSNSQHFHLAAWDDDFSVNKRADFCR